jgi:hypothetical protein
MSTPAYICGCFVRFENHITFCKQHQLGAELLETIRWMAQTIHQAHHQEHPGTFMDCQKNTCDAARQMIEKARTL